MLLTALIGWEVELLCVGAWPGPHYFAAPVLDSYFHSFEKTFQRVAWRAIGEQRERGQVLTYFHLPALGRRHRDSGQPEISRAGEGVEDATLRWAGPGMQRGRAI